MASSRSPNPHAIMISSHLQGHVNPFVKLAIALASKGFSITFAHLDFVHHRISKSRLSSSSDVDIFAQARNSGLDIRYTTISDGLPLNFDRSRNHDQFLEAFRYIFPDIVDDFVGKIIQSNASSSSAPDYFLIADTFSIWSAKIAKKYGLVNVSFWTEPALVFSLYYHWDLLRRNGDVPVGGRRVNVSYIPGVPSLNTKDFVSYFHDSEWQLLHHIIYEAFDLVKSADFVLCNTVEELESEAISALQATQPFYAVGPVFLLDSVKCCIAKSMWPESDCSAWLNTKPVGTVLYASFGSLATVDKHLIRTIAGGLLDSGVSFMWALRPGLVDSDGEILPEGFEDRIKERGVIVPWCNQDEVLSNPAVGGFLTHCGWNSILESVWNVVPMICHPLFTDQITNRKLVVDDWKVGMNLCDGEAVTKEEVAEKIGILMNGNKKSNELRQEIEKMKKTFKNGSSDKNFDRFLRELSDEIQRRCSSCK